MSDLFIRSLFTWRSAVASKFGPKKPTTRHVLLTLGLYMSDKGDSCFPATRTLKNDTGLSHRAVLTHLEVAEIEGWIGRRERLMRGKGWKRMEYFALIPHGVEAAIAADKDGEGRSPANVGEVGSPAEVDERPALRGERQALGGERSDAKVVKHVHLMSSVNTSLPSKEEKPAPHRPGEDYTPPPDVIAWVEANGWGPYLQLHIGEFRDTCTTQARKPYTVAGLDAAFRKCVRGDWGNVRKQAQMAARATGQAPLAPRAKVLCRYCPAESHGNVGGIPHCGNSEHHRKAMERALAPAKVAA